EYKHDNPLLSSGKISIYWMYEDFSRSYRRMPKDKLPVKEVGDAVLRLMLDVWHSSVPILNHGNALSKVGSFIESEFAVFVWLKNGLMRISEFDESEQEEIVEWLDKA
ncbi:MAG: hypothetical protein LC778_20855, partial [Acidobacteria bacterium]|nr:hypothetical protein [Acidobacteriota bacterium]